MQDLGLDSLIGLTISKAEINDTKDLVVLTTDKGTRYLTWEGDCCAHCFLANISGSDFLNNAVITKIENTEWSNVETAEDYEVIESMGTTLYTDKGTVTFESRVEHNGYYGGMLYVSDDEPIDQYHSPRTCWKEENLTVLVDF